MARPKKDVIEDCKNIVLGVYRNWELNPSKATHQLLLRNVFKLGWECAKQDTYNNRRMKDETNE